jgi:SAM-dependent methyltransferase
VPAPTHAYDRIGSGYAQRRRPDPRIGSRIRAALGSARTVVNVGAGAGAYEPTDRPVVAVEPSTAMIAQRPATAAPALRGVAGRLPFPDAAFDGGLAILTVHHWPDAAAGLAELRRVARGPVVVLSFDHAVHARQWLVTDYLPEMAGLDTDLPRPDAIADALGGGTVEVVPVPHDCTDGFCHAWWRRPTAYLDPAVRAAISGIARLPTDVVARAVDALRHDLDTGDWHHRHTGLLARTEIDAGYRLITSPG